MQQQELQEFLDALFELPEGIERDLKLFRWKHAKFPDAGIFSTAHGGDAAGNLQKALAGKLVWPFFAMINGRKTILKYEQNFAQFAFDLSEILKNKP